MVEQVEKHRIFVYGSLMKGFGNYPRLDGAKFIGHARTAPGFTMVSLGGFPGVCAAGETAIKGEIYEVDDDTLIDLDMLEGHPSFYERTPISVAMGDVIVDVETYLLPKKWLLGNSTVIKTGDWRNR